MYEYKDLINICKAHPTRKNINALAEWFERYGNEFWNGEYYAVVELRARLTPIYATEENETGSYDVVGCKLM